MISARVVSVALACLLLVGLGAACGFWLSARHYRPQLDAAQADLVACRAARGSLESMAAEQRQFMDDLIRQAEQRQTEAKKRQEEAEGRARAAERKAQEILMERTPPGEAACAAAGQAFDKELRRERGL
ncbi:hypothetical protein ACSEU4_23015 [Pseudomonas aeruginosa]